MRKLNLTKNKTVLLLSSLAGLALALSAALFYTASGSVSGSPDTSRELRAPSAHPAEFPPTDAAAFDGSVDPGQLLRDYSEWAQYPPNSRPLAASHIDVIEYRHIRAPMQAMPTKQNGEIVAGDYSCLLQPKTHSLVGDEQMHIFLSCARTGERELQLIEVQNLRLEARAGDRRFSPVVPTYNDDGEQGDVLANDRIVTFEFRPQASDWADMYLTVNFKIAGDASGTVHSLATHFFSSPVAPARFTGNIREEIRNESLVLSVELQVERAGNYTIEGNLMSENGEALAFARADANLKTGTQQMELQYYGKILRDRNIAGPYRLEGLRGSLNTDVIQPEMLARPPAEVAAFLKNVQDDRPKRMLIPYYEKSYSTRNYEPELFTDAVYTSPEKERRLSELRALTE